MITPSNKSKQYLLFALKVFILAITFGYIYSKVTTNNSLSIVDFIETVKTRKSSGLLILFFLSLASSNWFIEIIKWKTVVSGVAPISLKKATQQSLAALTVSLATPNRIGDYGAKAIFFEPHKRKQILLLNFFSNIVQLSATVFFGCIGLVYVIQQFGIRFSIVKVLLLLFFILVLVILGYIFKEKELLVKGLSASKVIQYFRNISTSTKIKVIIYSVARYIIFSTLFYTILLFFGSVIPFSEALFLIYSMYLFVSLIPTLFIFDVIIRGGVAVWLFSMAGVSELTVLSTVLTMWLLNFVFPAILGSFYVIGYNPNAK